MASNACLCDLHRNKWNFTCKVTPKVYMASVCTYRKKIPLKYRSGPKLQDRNHMLRITPNVCSSYSYPYRKKIQLKYPSVFRLKARIYIYISSSKMTVRIKSNVKVRCYFSAKDRNGSSICSHFHTSSRVTTPEDPPHYRCVVLDLKRKDPLFEKFLDTPDDLAILTFKVTTSIKHSRSDENVCSGSKSCFDRARHMTSLAQAFNDIPDSEAVKTVTLRVGEDVENVNKGILCACSPVFDRMFQTEMKEAKEESVTIEDLKIGIVRLMISFMYTGCIDELRVEDLQDLYYAANKYQITDLREQCMNKLLLELNVQNACEQLKFAHYHGDIYLKSDILSFMSMKLKSIIESEEWGGLLKTDPKLALEVFETPLNEDADQLNAPSNEKETYGRYEHDPVFSNQDSGNSLDSGSLMCAVELSPRSSLGSPGYSIASSPGSVSYDED